MLNAYDYGKFSVAQLVCLGTVSFDTTGISSGVKLATLPKNMIVLDWLCKVRIAFNAATTNVLKLGTSDDDDAFMGTSDITEGTAGFYRKNTVTEQKQDLDVYAKYTQTGSAATAGKADFYALVVCTPSNKVTANTVTLNKDSTSIVAAATETLTATITPADADEQGVEWSSSDTDVATVSDAGVVTGVAAGTCTITCKSKDVAGAQDTCAVTITAS